MAKRKSITATVATCKKSAKLPNWNKPLLKKKFVCKNQFISEQVRNLTPEERSGSKGKEVALAAVEAVNRLERQGAIVKLEATRQINDEIEKGHKKADELTKKATSIFDSLFTKLNAQNPIALAFSEGQKELDKLKESLKGLSPELQKQAIAIQTKLNADKFVFGAARYRFKRLRSARPSRKF